MPDRLSLRSTLLLVVLAFGLAFAVQAPLGSGFSAAEPAAKKNAPGLVASAPAAEPDLSLEAAGTVPALRDPRQPRKRRVRTRKNKPSARTVLKAAPKLAPAPVMRAAPVPTPTVAPRYSPPAPPRSTPAPEPKRAAPEPKPTPAPTATPVTSGEFDSSSEEP